MEIVKINETRFDIEENIITVSLSASNEFVMLMSSGDVIRYNIDEQKKQFLFSVKSNFSFEDGGFDIESPSTIYTLDSIVVIVNDYKKHGFVHYPEKYNSLHLWRKDYHAAISTYPIALFKDEVGIPHLIYGEAWNHIQIMNLDTRQILTASKSLIEEKAEEKQLEFYKKHKEQNKLPWPRPYDYFFGELKVSPDNKNFLSAGWAWGSCDAYTVYDIDDFIKSNRISVKYIGGWEHCNRAVCWIDNETVAVTYNPFEEGDEDSTKDSPQEIHFYKVNNIESEIIKKVKVIDLEIVNSKMYFKKDLDLIIFLSDKIGLALISLEGEKIFHDEKMNQDKYDSNLNLFIKKSDKSVVIYQIKKHGKTKN